MCIHTCTYVDIHVTQTQTQLVFDDLEMSGTNSLRMPDALGLLFSYSYALGARIHTNSWGPMYPDGAYSTDSMEVDK